MQLYFVLVLVLGLHVLVLALAPLVLVLVLDDIVLATRLAVSTPALWSAIFQPLCSQFTQQGQTGAFRLRHRISVTDSKTAGRDTLPLRKQLNKKHKHKQYFYLHHRQEQLMRIWRQMPATG